MKFKQDDVVKLIKPLFVRTSMSAGTYPIGTELKIQQVSENTRKYLIGNEWIHHTRVENAVA